LVSKISKVYIWKGNHFGRHIQRNMLAEITFSILRIERMICIWAGTWNVDGGVASAERTDDKRHFQICRAQSHVRGQSQQTASTCPTGCNLKVGKVAPPWVVFFWLRSP
jgi:hypothetical protein